MKALKLTLMVALMIAALSSCTREDLNEDDVLIEEQSIYKDGDIQQR